MSEPFVTVLRKANVTGIQPSLWIDAQGTLATSEMDLATHVTLNLSSTSSNPIFKLTDASGYKEYTIWTVLFFFMKKELDHPSYLRLLGKSTSGRDAAPVSFIDRKDLLDYLAGATESSANMRPAGPSKSDSLGAAEVSASTTQEAFLGDLQRKRMLVTKETRMDLEIVKRMQVLEKTVNTAASVMSISGPKNFANIQKLAYDKFIRAKDVRSSQAAAKNSLQKTLNTKQAPTSIKKSSQKHAKHVSKQAKEIMPIIIVPAAAQSVLTLYNVKEFLIDQKFIPTDTYRNRGENKPVDVTLERDPMKLAPGAHQKFLVLDSVETLRPHDWDRVVAVITMGQEWQFRGWKWEKPVEIFHNVLGFSLKFVDEPPPGQASLWNVENLNIHRSRRYLDGTVVYSFWQLIDGYMRGPKSSVFQ
ncbi:hypothetical protein BATDEDRAFT_35087 [Batrachochytrium dendrobatidis JAM81]|uniref:Cell division control protein 73 C-terminal domain-containing protein n=1 Tax=Batrachochytrium dendrobatidis (strain JAM81 / FGSC 10211) TaxID=684364 RepID=F4P2J3_BATDJ|nr:uncharacterized protein BATDEDRAFT_35087 [Batrachochytrium dendrobatidis JAM81]EGF80142.1 hypothetical protein BATDEDRAFT_35087 [Batrachochytrium dendrobatidis JAM81]|eukprot:XP_006679102.1 hypothetical protein BATDEDRAFT_35087 [Batrachochytrium dendrobatidis JAM81]